GALFDPTSSNYSTFGARWYNAYTGAFTTQDTSNYLANPENGNRYAYAGADPVNNIDPTGNSFLSWVEGVGEDLASDAYAALDATNACLAGAGALEEAAEPAEGAIALLPGGDTIGEAGIPLFGCLVGTATERTLDYNVLG
ncbi:MAG TPA: RHS repeat-associated core domain-containing protein, partial [Streptosporangiaceae bacterium]